jgi:hypothetical protein
MAAYEHPLPWLPRLFQNPMTAIFHHAIIAAAMTLTSFSLQAQPPELPKDMTRTPVVFTGGHDTDPRDGGRPVALIAAALGVPPDVFRDAFSRVHPADPRVGPTGDEARQNKMVLMNALGKYGITNERLDEVSNYYRYVRSRGELWTNREAKANALVKNGAITGYEIIDGGSGYTSPVVTAPGAKGEPVKAQLSFGKNLETNGAVSAIVASPAGK